MAYLYQDIAKSVALRANQIMGGDAATRKIYYESSSILTLLDGTEIPAGALKQDILAAAAEIAAMIGASKDSIYRRSIEDQSANIANGARVPLSGLNGDFIGAISGIYDSATNTPLTEQPIQVVRRRVENPGSFWIVPTFHYAIESDRIYHTRDNVYIRACSWDQDAQSAAFDQITSGTGSATVTSSDINTSTDVITEVGHGFLTGTRVSVSSSGTLPAPLNSSTPYWVIRHTADTFSLAGTLNDALSGSAVDITTGGSGTHNIAPSQPFATGVCPLPVEMKVLHICKVLAALPQEGWFVAEGSYYKDLVTSLQNDIVNGKTNLMTMPSMPETTSRAEPIKG